MKSNLIWTSRAQVARTVGKLFFLAASALAIYSFQNSLAKAAPPFDSHPKLNALLRSNSLIDTPAYSVIQNVGPNDIGFATSSIVAGASGGTTSGAFTGTNVNTLLGADTFYAAGYDGTGSRVANIEAGHAWNGHEALAHATQITPVPYTSGGNLLSLNEVDRHATWASSMSAGRPTAGANEYQRGMAYNADLYSGAFAGQWSGTRYALGFTFFYTSLFDQYEKAVQGGLTLGGPRADTVNSSWGGSDPAGTNLDTIGLDGLAYVNPGSLMVYSAGNSGPGNNTVGGPGSGFNGMAVAALGANPTFDSPSSFSSGGLSNYSDPVNGTATNARVAVDIAAPGQQLGGAYYGGETGGNGTTNSALIDDGSVPPPSGSASLPAGGSDFYSRSIAGTSFSAPIVAGGAALLYDAAYDQFPANANARDARVMKAVLMNSADKTAGWNNGQAAHSNGNGGVVTTQSLDLRVGAGRMNLDQAFDQFLSGTTDVSGTAQGNLGSVQEIGWDYGLVQEGTFNDYYIQPQLVGGSTLTATLTWFRDRLLTNNGGGSYSASDRNFDDLDLQVYTVVAGTPTLLISESISAFNESEHLSFALPATAYYMLRVNFFGEIFDAFSLAPQEFYGLAWSAVAVPEPASAALLLMGLLCTVRMSRQRRRK
jgi:hypothetical protein